MLFHAAFNDLPSIEALRTAYGNVDQRQARELFERFKHEMGLIDALG